MIRVLFLLITVTACLHSPLSQAGNFPDRFDPAIQKAAKRFLPVAYRLWGYEILKAQYYQESRLDPTAISPVGAQGIAQFMPATRREVFPQLGLDPMATWVDADILAGAYYMSRQRAIWTSKRSERDRHSLALASYNAGAGNIIKAQRLCGGVPEYVEIVRCLPSVTGHHADETRTYVPRIWRYWEQMRLGL